MYFLKNDFEQIQAQNFEPTVSCLNTVHLRGQLDFEDVELTLLQEPQLPLLHEDSSL